MIEVLMIVVTMLHSSFCFVGTRNGAWCQVPLEIAITDGELRGYFKMS